MAISKTRVIVVTGYPRSGTTLLARILSQATHGVAVGELFDLIQTSPKAPICGCGQPFAECEFWKPVIKAIFGGWDEEYFNNFRQLAQSVGRAKHILQLAYPQIRSPEYRARMEEVVLILGKLYRKVQAISGHSVIVESSKSPVFPVLLMQEPTLDVRVVQLIRDSRAVAYSVLKRSNVVGAPTGNWNVPMTDYAKIAREWTAHNLVFELDRMLTRNWQHIRYERFVTEPMEVIRSIFSRLGKTDLDWSCFTGSNTVNLQRNHIIGANRNRFAVGERSIQLDNEWRTMMSWQEKSLVTFITLPMLLWHRYPLVVPA